MPKGSRRKKYFWVIIINDIKCHIQARTPGAVFRQAVRRLIRTNYLKRQPPSDERGWYKGTSLPQIHRSQ